MTTQHSNITLLSPPTCQHSTTLPAASGSSY
jgi:hypothetical protein